MSFLNFPISFLSFSKQRTFETSCIQTQKPGLITSEGVIQSLTEHSIKTEVAVFSAGMLVRGHIFVAALLLVVMDACMECGWIGRGGGGGTTTTLESYAFRFCPHNVVPLKNSPGNYRVMNGS